MNEVVVKSCNGKGGGKTRRKASNGNKHELYL